MSLVGAFLELRASKAGTSKLATPADWLTDLVGGRSVTGKSVTPTTALNVVAVYACVRILAETIASLPLPVYHRLPEGGKERDPNHRLYPILHDLPNPEMTSFELREALMGHLALWGNAYAEIERDAGYRVRGLWPLRPDRMAIYRGQDKRLVYEYRLASGGTVLLDQDQVLHVRGLSNDGIVGYSPVTLAREAIGLALATEEYGARFFGNDSRPGGALRYPGKLSEDAQKRLKASWEAAHSGLSQAHRIAVLEEGIEWQQIGLPPGDAQFLESRKFQTTEIARLYRVPPHMLADLERATFSNIEHQSIEFVVHTIRPWLVRWEQEFYRSLFTEAERQTWFAEFLVDGLLRGDIQSRYAAYATARQNGWLNADEIRELENQNPLPEGAGQVYWMPLNVMPATAGSSSPSSPPPSATGGRAFGLLSPAPQAGLEDRAVSGRKKLARNYRRLFEDATTRIVKREEADVMRAAEKHLGRRDASSFKLWLERFYNDHPAYVERTMLPLLLSYADAVSMDAAAEINQVGGLTPELERFVRDYGKIMASDWSYSSLGQIHEVIDQAEAAGEDPLVALAGRFQEWHEKRPGKVADQHTVEAAGAVTRETWKRGGVRKLRWVAIGKSCPYCSALDGKIVGIEEQFISKDQDFHPAGADKPLRPGRHVRHAPAHGGCDCDIAPA